MNFLLKLSVAQKIFLIPIIGAVSFITFVVINSIVSAQNASQLQMAKNVDFPALQLSTTVLTNMEKVRDTLASSVTTGDIEAIDAAKEKVKVVVDDLQAVRRIDPSLSADVNVLQSTFSAYSDQAIDVTASILNETADFATLGDKLFLSIAVRRSSCSG